MTVLDESASAVSDAFLGFGNVLKEQRHIVNVKDYAIDGVVLEGFAPRRLGGTRSRLHPA